MSSNCILYCVFFMNKDFFLSCCFNMFIFSAMFGDKPFLVGGGYCRVSAMPLMQSFNYRQLPVILHR